MISLKWANFKLIYYYKIDGISHLFILMFIDLVIINLFSNSSGETNSSIKIRNIVILMTNFN